ncbi:MULTISPECIES: b(o/a)3-type cytochrome-c oxidase subunit 1 [Paenibacillus]|uniref:Subunit 1 of cytochrome c oxidase n=1 Tax=Paenibacillus naphthalenovorans TaxID=162209 RepID=A0A0U2UJL4_9BACL|nr:MULTISPECIES: b(o/a)3-type cytochrome-c oxidase subunit 1 [Paenibacillus]ALS23340.1 subunit 1 of cytochrome c oxidase [Paenibacillus naphthalenovorans]NTZ17088.1 b(o/a)3-type cytochrome-c oxidase subunit 1 [Paenibacillus sp. JMULE4]GCL72820.1 cytochrome C [Paenibacillus naphthalenovorans]SDI08269.1 cytochrome c oxidase subunit 1 [Paenibacillus naphthalenovorans]
MINDIKRFDSRDSALVLAHILFAFFALFLGGVAGVLQGLVRGGMIHLPMEIGYYQLLTAHGLLMALVFTTYFIIGFMLAGIARTLGGHLLPIARKLGWLGYGLMTFGTILATILILLNKATVLYTFYAPMKASPWFYIALVFVVVGSWMSGLGIFINYRYWKKTHRGQTTPLFAYMAVITMLLWIIATLGVAVEVLFQLIPWSFGWVDTVNVVLSRTLFWYFGHPLVYFWLLPAYMCWYCVIPKVIGGKIFSDALARLSFIMFLIFSIPVGFHHQLMEPGVSNIWKFVQVILTFMVVIPSLMTAFSLFATFELHGRSVGAKGLFGWFKKLPWKDVRFFAPFMGMLIFIPAGAGGLINASHQLNAVIHNTLWVTGHFHLTVASSVALTFFGITYWLIPAILGRQMTPLMHRLGIIQTVIWAVGMFFMSGSMHSVGLLGSPRRTAFTTYQDHPDAIMWIPYHVVMAIGGTILFVGVVLMIINIVMLLSAPKGETEFPIAEVSEQAEKTPAVFERWGVWIGVLVVLILVAYAIPVTEMITNPGVGAKGFVTW